MSERRTDEIEYGSWPTATARDGDPRRAPTKPGTIAAQRKRERGAVMANGLPSDDLASAVLWQPESARPTPASRDWRDDGDCPSAQARKSPCLPAAVTLAMWPTTATASGANATLTDATVGPRGPEKSSTTGKNPALWTTPCADDTGARKNKYAQGGTALSTQVRARLNHRWVAQLLGFPSDWLDDIDEQP